MTPIFLGLTGTITCYYVHTLVYINVGGRVDGWVLVDFVTLLVAWSILLVAMATIRQEPMLGR